MWRRLLAGALLMLTAAGSAALTLGRVQGVPWIGRPLSLNVRVDLDAGAAPEICASAEVFFGDNRIERNRVTIAMEPAATGQAVLRLRTTVPVDEPVVTVYLQAGCGQALTRRYVLLSEQPGDAPELPLTRPAAEAVAAVPLGPSLGRPAAAPRPAVPPGRSAAAAPAASAQVAAAAARPPKSARRAEQATARPAARSRLRIDPIDLGPEREPNLRLSGALSAGTEATPAQRAEAAAFWRALNARTEDTIRDAQRVQALESDMRSLREAVGRNSTAVGDLRGQLERARNKRYANPVVYALAALALLALAWAAWAWRRGARSRNGEGDWWRDVAEDSEPAGPATRRSLPGFLAASGARPGPGDVDSSSNLVARMEAAPAAVPAPAPDAKMHVPAQVGADFRPSRSELTEFANSASGGLRAAKAEEVHDVQQQADFFISLGEHERAIDVLRSHINAHPETSPVAWLDLLAIYHRMHLREDYEATRQEFEQVFNATAPEFDAYQLQSQGSTLETYPEALERITALWPSPKVLDLIATAIFRHPGAQEEPFGLEAYRELLLLHGIAKELSESGDDNLVEFSPSSGFSDFDSTQIQPLSAAPSGQADRAARAARVEPMLPDLLSPEVDIDIDQLGPPEDSMQIIGIEPDAAGHGHAQAAIDFNLDIDEPPPVVQFRPRKRPSE